MDNETTKKELNKATGILNTTIKNFNASPKEFTLKGLSDSRKILISLLTENAREKYMYDRNERIKQKESSK